MILRPFDIKVNFENVSQETDLVLNYSFNENFDLIYQNNRPFEDSQQLHNGYANIWQINIDEITDKNDTMDFSITVFSRSQLVFKWGTTISTVILVIYLGFKIYETRQIKKN